MSFRAFVVTKDGDRIGTEVTELADDELGEDPVLIDVEWSALNFKDTMVVQPGNRVARRSPLIPGIDLAGTVVASDADGVEVGSMVLAHGYDLGVAHHGGFAGRARVPAGWVVPLPEAVSPRHAVTVGTAGFTAALSLRRLEANGVRPDHGPVLVTGASGGVGSMAVSLLARHGYEVVASTGKASEHRYLTGLGATTVIGRDEVMGEQGRVLGQERWAAAIDCVGGETLAAVLRSLRYGGAVAASGLTGGNAFSSTVYPFIVRGVALLGVDSVETPIEERRSIWRSVGVDFPRDAVSSMVAGEIGLDGIAGALEDMAAARVRGRVLVEPGR
jgi:putative YhdH/YhfP family quinone oxidoreductase